MAPLTEETTKLRYITPAILKVGWDLENISYEALSDIRSEDAMEMRIPLLPRKHKEYRRTKKLRQLRSLQGLTQRKVTQQTTSTSPPCATTSSQGTYLGLSMFGPGGGTGSHAEGPLRNAGSHFNGPDKALFRKSQPRAMHYLFSIDRSSKPSTRKRQECRS